MHMQNDPRHSHQLEIGTDSVPLHENPCQVILFNDDVNSMEHVVVCLMRVFGHNAHLATKIMFDAHAQGKTIAETEAEGPACLHRDQLQSYGLIATVEKL